MAGKYWREAATLILVGRTAPKVHNRLQMTNALKFKKNWVPPNYDLLFLKRSSRSSFMPSMYVFPGGSLDKADLDPEWLSIFKDHGYSQDMLIKSLRHSGHRPELYTNKTEEDLLPELAFRICALRETFEETGVLLASPSGPTTESFASVYPLQGEELKEWRRKVHDDGSQFMKLMESINAVPSVLHLYEWVSWLTPLVFKSEHRFDTAFYIAFVDCQIPILTHDEKEAEEIRVEGPCEILKSFHDENISLAPPQVYELSRLLHCPTLDSLKDFSISRSTQGMARIFPVVIQAEDGLIFAYPGDSLYPTEPDFHGLGDTIQTHLSIEQARVSSTWLNRLEQRSRRGSLRDMVVNVIQPYDHLSPLSFTDLIDQS